MVEVRKMKIPSLLHCNASPCCVSNEENHMKTRKNMLTSALLCLAFGGVSHPGYGATLGFQPPVSYPVGTAPRAVAFGDFNGDGMVDLAVANSGNAVGDNGNVSILLGNGDGTFLPANNIPAGKNPFSIAVGDFIWRQPTRRSRMEMAHSRRMWTMQPEPVPIPWQ